MSESYISSSNHPMPTALVGASHTGTVEWSRAAEGRVQSRGGGECQLEGGGGDDCSGLR